MRKQKNYPLYKVEPFNDFREMLSKAECDSIAFKYKINRKVREVSYRDFKKDVDTLSAALYATDLEGKHIAMIGENSYRWINVYLSVLCCTGVYVPIDAKLPTSEIINVVNDSDSEVLFYSESFREAIEDNSDKMPNVKQFIYFDPDDLLDKPSSIAAHGRFTNMNNMFDIGRQKLIGNIYLRKNEPDDLKLLVYTSGTTGISKGVMLSQKNLVSGVYYGLQVSTVFDSCLSVLPYHHTYEAVCGILVGLHMNVTICINESLKAVADNIKLYKPAYILLVPLFVESFYKKIWKEAERTGKDKALKGLIKFSNFLRFFGIDVRRKLFKSVLNQFGGNLQKLVCGGAPIRAEMGKFFDDIGITLVNGYGITECSPLVAANRDYYNDCATVGCKLPCCEVRLDDKTEDGTGEIAVKGDIVMLGYYKNKVLTDEVLKDGWFSTGDYGCFDAESRLCIRGRKKNLIVLNNGENIYPEEIENYILSIPLIKEVVVYSVMDKNGGECGLCAEIYANEDVVKSQSISDVYSAIWSSIKTLCEKLPTHKRISKVVIRDKEFEKTTSAKIKRSFISAPKVTAG